VIQVSSLERWTVHEPHEDLLVLVHALHEKRFEQVLEHELESVSGIYRGLSDAGEAGGTCRSWRGRRPESPAGPGGPCRDLALSWRLMRAKLIAEPGALPAITANERGWPRFKVVRGDEIIDVDVDLQQTRGARWRRLARFGIPLAGVVLIVGAIVAIAFYSTAATATMRSSSPRT
jgi:hypothetical protein